MIYKNKKNVRIVVTGLGCISPVGNCVSDMWNSIINGYSGIDYIKNINVSHLPVRFAGEVKNFNKKSLFINKNSNFIDNFINFGIYSGIQAIEDCGLNINCENSSRIGVIIGSGMGGLSMLEKTCKKLNNLELKRVSPFFIPNSILNIISSNLSIKYGLKGPNLAISTACASGLHCIGIASRLIKYGDADVMIAGGSESNITLLSLCGFSSIKILSSRNEDPKTASRPWDKDRDGFVLGEGCGVLVLEEYNHAKKRGANIYAELLGFGMNSDAYHITSPNLNGPSECIKLALLDANINYTDIQYINAHGSSTILGDINETNVIKTIFKDYSHKIVISSTKSMTGHLLGGSGGLESVITVLSIYNQISPPTINIFNQDLKCDLDYCKLEARNMLINIALKNSFGFGGTNGVIVFSKI